MGNRRLHQHLKLNLVSGFTSTAFGNWAKANCGRHGGKRLSACSAAVVEAGCTHVPLVVGDVGDRKPRDLPEFKWVNTVLGNLKTTVARCGPIKETVVGRHAEAAY